MDVAAFPADNREVAYRITILLSGRFTYIEFDVFQCTVKDLVQSLTVDSNTVSKHMSRTSVRQDVILAKDTPRMVAEAARRPADAERGEKNRRQLGIPNKLSNNTMATDSGHNDGLLVSKIKQIYRHDDGFFKKKMFYRNPREFVKQNTNTVRL